MCTKQPKTIMKNYDFFYTELQPPPSHIIVNGNASLNIRGFWYSVMKTSPALYLHNRTNQTYHPLTEAHLHNSD